MFAADLSDGLADRGLLEYRDAPKFSQKTYPTQTLAAAQELVTIPNAGGRWSTRILPDPDAVLRVKEQVARAIEALR